MLKLLLLLIHFLVCCFGGVSEFEFDDLRFDVPVVSSSSLDAPLDAPFSSGDGTASVTVEVNFGGTPRNLSEIWLYVVHQSRLDLIRRSDAAVQGPRDRPGTRHYCCSERLRQAQVCDQYGSPLVNWTALPANTADIALELFRAPFDNEPRTERFNVSVSGLWSLYFVNCQAHANATIKGTIVWKNPYGYLPADLALLMPTYIALCLAHALLASWWWFLVWRAKPGQVVRLQHLLGFLLILMWLEQFLFALDWSIYNYETGTISVFFNVTSALLAAVRNVACFSLLLLVAMGWMIFRPRLTKYWRQAVVAYGTAALIFSAVWQFVAMLDYTPQLYHLALPEVASLLVSIPAVLLDFGYVGWIGLEMYRSSYLLGRHGQLVKKTMYRHLALALVFGAGLAVFLFALEAIFSIAGLYSQLYRGWWVFTAAWPFILLMVVTTMAWLLRPGPGTEKLRQIELPTELDDRAGGAGAGGDAGHADGEDDDTLDDSNVVLAAPQQALEDDADLSGSDGPGADDFVEEDDSEGVELTDVDRQRDDEDDEDSVRQTQSVSRSKKGKSSRKATK